MFTWISSGSFLKLKPPLTLGNHYASQDLRLMKMWAIWRDGKHIYCLPAAVALSQTPSLDIYTGRIHSSAFSSHIVSALTATFNDEYGRIWSHPAYGYFHLNQAHMLNCFNLNKLNV